MKMRFLVFALVLTALVCGAAASDEPVMRVEWRFEPDPEEGRWTATSDVTDLRMAGGLLIGKATGENAAITSSRFSFRPNFYDVVEMMIMVENAGEARLSWSESADNPEGGFTSAKKATFYVSPDANQPVRVYPFWHKDDEIQQIRLHLPEGEFRIAMLRIRKQIEPIAPVSQMHNWRTVSSLRDWNLLQGDAVRLMGAGIPALTISRQAIIASPTLRVSSDLNKAVSVRMRVSDGKTAALGWVTSERNGIHFIPFDIKADGEMHTYTIDLSESKEWADQIRLITLKPSDAPEAEVAIESVSIKPNVEAEPLGHHGHHH